MPAFVARPSTGKLATYDGVTLTGTFIDANGKLIAEGASVGDIVDLANVSEFAGTTIAADTFTAETTEVGADGVLDVAVDEFPEADTSEADDVAGLVIHTAAGVLVAVHTWTPRAGVEADPIAFGPSGIATYKPAPGDVVRGIGAARPDSEGIIDPAEVAAQIEIEIGSGSLTAGITELTSTLTEGAQLYTLPEEPITTLMALVAPGGGGPHVGALRVPTDEGGYDWLVAVPAANWAAFVFTDGTGAVTPTLVGSEPESFTDGTLMHLWGDGDEWWVAYHVEIPEVDLPGWLDGFVRPQVIFSRLHFGDGVAEDIDPATGLLAFPLDETPWGDYANAPIIDGLPWRGGTILIMGQPSQDENGPWDLVYDDATETWSGVRPTAINGWVTAELVAEGMTFWVGSGERYNNTHWTPSWSSTIEAGDGTLNPVYASLEALEGEAATNGQVLTRDSTADRGYSWQDASGSGPSLSNATPQALGSATAGTSPDASRADHVHAMPSVAALNGARVVGAVGQQTAVTHGSLGSATSLLGSTINLPTNMAAGGRIMVEGIVNGVQDSGGSRTITFGIRVGATTVLTLAGTWNASATTIAHRFEASIRLASTSAQTAAGSQVGRVSSAALGSGAEDVTTTKALDVTVQSSSTASTQSFQLEQLTVTYIPPA